MLDNGLTRRDLVGATAALTCAMPGSSSARVEQARSLNFLVVGDWGRDGKTYQRHVAAQMAWEAMRCSSKFIVSTGDNFYNLGVSSVDDRRWDTSFDQIYKHASLQTPWYPVLGNHDYGGSIGAQLDRTGRFARWHMPERWHRISGAEHAAPFVDLFFIDTVVWAGRESFPYNLLGSTLDHADQAAQKRWLTDALLASNAPVKVVFGHHPIYSVGKHGGKAKFNDLDRLLRHAGATAYVNGHDHCLYHIRSKAMDYICSGGGSQELTAFTGDPSHYGCVLPNLCPGGVPAQDSPRWLSFVDRAGFASFNVNELGLTFRLIDRSGVIFHEHAISVRPPDHSVNIE